VVSRCPAGDWSGHWPVTAVDDEAGSGRRRLGVVAQRRRRGDRLLAVAISGAPGRRRVDAVAAVLVGLGLVDDAASRIVRVNQHRLLLLLLLLMVMVMVMLLVQTVGGDHVRTALRIVVVIPGDVLVCGVVIWNRSHVTDSASVRR